MLKLSTVKEETSEESELPELEPELEPKPLELELEPEPELSELELELELPQPKPKDEEVSCPQEPPSELEPVRRE